MNTSAPPSAPPTRARPGIGSVLCGFTLAVGHFVSAYLVLIAYMADPSGPWDSETVAHSNFASGLGLALTVITALMTWVFVKAEWLRRWWYAVPTVLAVAELLRLTVLAPEL